MNKLNRERETGRKARESGRPFVALEAGILKQKRGRRKQEKGRQEGRSAQNSLATRLRPKRCPSARAQESARFFYAKKTYIKLFRLAANFSVRRVDRDLSAVDPLIGSKGASRLVAKKLRDPERRPDWWQRSFAPERALFPLDVAFHKTRQSKNKKIAKKTQKDQEQKKGTHGTIGITYS